MGVFGVLRPVRNRDDPAVRAPGVSQMAAAPSPYRRRAWSPPAAAAVWMRLRAEPLAFLAVLAVAIFLRFFRLDDTAQNLYYAAGVRSMLTSWHNFFYVSFEPSGSVMIDKPPLGLWLETGVARVAGFHYWALALPQAVSGVAAVALLFFVIRRTYGGPVALLAAGCLAVLPVSVASARNNTFDTLTMFFALAAAWALLEAVRRGSLGWLLLSAAMLGLGFNTKMSEAFLPLPAFALFFAAQSSLPRKRRLAHGAAFAAVLAAVSLSWVAAVGLTPAADRPTVYNGDGNSIWALTFRYNGIDRVIGTHAQQRIRGTAPLPADGDTALFLKAAQSPPRGPFRLLVGKLGTQIAWFLPLAAAGVLVVARRRRTPLPGDILWVSWFVSGALYFSVSAQAVPQYLESIAAPVAVLAALGLKLVADLLVRRRAAGAAFVAANALLSVVLLVSSRGESRAALPIVVAALVVMVAAGSLIPHGPGHVPTTRVARTAVAAAFLALFAGPVAWSAVTAAEPAAGVAARYPVAGPAEYRNSRPATGGDFPPTSPPGPASDPALALMAAATPGGYLVLAERSLFGNAARYVIETGRPVLTFDAFQADQLLAARTLAQLHEAGKLRFLELPAAGPWADPITPLGVWFGAHCTDVTATGARPLGGETNLYDCR
ncbi:MAG: glycosyltransferase family 39 protein [Chloroflexi bacterium]|nr:glycosyltransferase family 39 protein [Chloroflexota bacterium]